jgi:hypothetical protein
VPIGLVGNLSFRRNSQIDRHKLVEFESRHGRNNLIEDEFWQDCAAR